MAISFAAIEDDRQVRDQASMVCPRRPVRLLGGRGLRERRAMRLAQSSQVVVSPRWAAEAVSSVHRFQLARVRRESLTRRRAASAARIAARNFSATAQLSAAQRTSRPAPSTPAPPSSSCSAAATAAAAAVRRVSVAESESVCPENYLMRLLEVRGLGGKRVATKVSSAEVGYHCRPTAKQIRDYDSQPFMSDLVRKGDVDGLRLAVKAGKCMDASNKFGESVVHVACRRGNIDILRFLVANGGSLTCCDDLGRFPLHDVCWAATPRFDIVRLFLDDDRGRRQQQAAASTGDGDDGLNMLLVTDKRGCSPLRYVKQDSWPAWRRFLDEVVDDYWPSPVVGNN